MCGYRSVFTDVLVPVLLAFVVLGLVCSVHSQEIGCEERLRSDLFSTERDVIPYLDQLVFTCNIGCVETLGYGCYMLTTPTPCL